MQPPPPVLKGLIKINSVRILSSYDQFQPSCTTKKNKKIGNNETIGQKFSRFLIIKKTTSKINSKKFKNQSILCNAPTRYKTLSENALNSRIGTGRPVENMLTDRKKKKTQKQKNRKNPMHLSLRFGIENKRETIISYRNLHKLYQYARVQSFNILNIKLFFFPSVFSFLSLFGLNPPLQALDNIAN